MVPADGTAGHHCMTTTQLVTNIALYQLWLALQRQVVRRWTELLAELSVKSGLFSGTYPRFLWLLIKCLVPMAVST